MQAIATVTDTSLAAFRAIALVSAHARLPTPWWRADAHRFYVGKAMFGVKIAAGQRPVWVESFPC